MLDSASTHVVPVAASRGTLSRLTSLRAFAALAVFLSHLDIRGGTVGPAGPLVAYGYLGVGFFFVLSGFVLTWSYAPGSGVGAFYVRRFARIWPSHAVMLVAALLAPVTIIDASAAQLLPTAALVQTWVPGVLDPYWLNGVSWSLSCEVAFYLVLPLLLPLLLRRGARTRWGLAVGWWAAAGAVTAAVVLMTSGWADAAYTYPPLRFGEFLLGVAAALELRRGRRFHDGELAALALLGVAGVVLTRAHFPVPDAGAALTFLAIVVWAAQRDLNAVGGILTRRSFVYAGEVSFAFYLVHELVLLNVSHITGLHGWAADAVLVPATCLAALALHTVVERPCERRLRALAGQARRAADPSPAGAPGQSPGSGPLGQPLHRSTG